jgi:histone-lysine N-methyltransferase SETMAR
LFQFTLIGIYYHHDNAPCHTGAVAKNKLNEMGWKVMPHPPYSPDIAPSDYYLFQKLQHYLNSNKLVFKNAREAIAEVNNFLDSQPTSFFKNGIDKLIVRWQDVINNGGSYLKN